MATQDISLALETSSAFDSIAVGQGDQLLETVLLPERAPGRSSNLMPAIAELFTRLNLKQADLCEIYVSVGPGSFTGLRIGIAAAQMLASVLKAKTVAVPTIDVVAQNTPASETPLLVCLNQKRDSVYTATFEHEGDRWSPIQPASVMTITAALQHAPRPVQLLSQTQIELDNRESLNIERLPTEIAIPEANIVWRLGRDIALKDAYTDAPRLLPIYARVPEAVELWDKRHG